MDEATDKLIMLIIELSQGVKSMDSRCQATWTNTLYGFIEEMESYKDAVYI